MLAVLGASHRELDPAELDSLAAAPSLAPDLAALTQRESAAIAGVVTLLTCNRFEIYVETRRFHDSVDDIIRVVAGASGMTPAEVGERLQVRVGEQAAAHLFRVAVGLDSMVVGEREISGQVAKALRAAHEADSTTPALYLLFESAAHVAKQVAAETDLAASGRSVAAGALRLAIERVGSLAEARVLLVGTGSYARVVAANLDRRGCREVSVYSPSGRQAQFASGRGLTPVSHDELADAIRGCDVIVTCSGRGAWTLDRASVAPLLAARHRPLCVVDLALRGDTAPDLRTLEGVTVIDLRAAAQAAGNVPHTAIECAEALVRQAVTQFQERLATRRLDPAVLALREHVSATVRREFARLRRRLPGVDRAELDHTAHRLTQALLHTPTVRARLLARDGAETDYLAALHALFGIDVAIGATPARQDTTAQG